MSVLTILAIVATSLLVVLAYLILKISAKAEKDMHEIFKNHELH